MNLISRNTYNCEKIRVAQIQSVQISGLDPKWCKKKTLASWLNTLSNVWYLLANLGGASLKFQASYFSVNHISELQAGNF